MANLDYAFLADFAKVEPNGTLTTVGASFTFVTAVALPTTHQMAVAGRARGGIDEDAIPLRIEIVGPDEAFQLGAEGLLLKGPHARPYGGGLIGHVFALNVQIPLSTEGLYVVNVRVGDEAPRRLAFDVVTPPAMP